ncbi:LytR/AlgR family response regulator transcription factor [Caldimonas sp. KR1-144]|uniref:LytR/AlgR family response regulator transcription factor n=1 Tax=Caldimonas sp. KR1-144 TaxID=3400911 RepID=UPI003BFC549E
MPIRPTAIVADDEPLLRERLVRLLGELWPELEVLGEARNGREAVELAAQCAPAVVFLDIRMPGLNGVEAARAIGRKALVVFVTAYDEYAVQAFEQGAIDYLIKPFEPQRLADTVARLKERLESAGAGIDDEQLDAVLRRLAARIDGPRPTAWLQWIRASVGPAIKLIPVEQVLYLRSDEKYTLVVWEGGEALIRKSIRELIEELDPERFVQIHRSVIVNLHRVVQVLRGANDTAELQIKGRSETLPVSRSYLHRFRQM